MKFVLIGAGSAHLKLIQHLIENPRVDRDVVLVHTSSRVSPKETFVYNMVQPELKADLSVDLRRLCTLAGVTFIEDHVLSLDTENQSVRFHCRASFEYDILSLDLVDLDLRNSAPLDYVFASSELSQLLTRVQEIDSGLEKLRPKLFNIAFVGGSLRNIQLAMILKKRLDPYVSELNLEIFEKENQLVPYSHPKLRQALEKKLREQDIIYRTHQEIVDITDHKVLGADKKVLWADVDVVFNDWQKCLPEWLRTAKSFSDLTELEIHKNFMLKSSENIFVSRGSVQSYESLEEQTAFAEQLTHIYNTGLRLKERSFSGYCVDPIPLPSEEVATVSWGQAKLSETLWKSQRKEFVSLFKSYKGQIAQLVQPTVSVLSEVDYTSVLKEKLVLEFSEDWTKKSFSSRLKAAPGDQSWYGKNYRDFFSDPYLSGYYTALDVLDKAYLKVEEPQCLRLFIASPQSEKDVQILNQIVAGSFRAIESHCEFRIQLCDAGMNTVHYNLLSKSNEKETAKESSYYIGLTQPLGLYSLFSQQGQQVWTGEWLTPLWPKLNLTLDRFAFLDTAAKNAIRVCHLGDEGLANDLVNQLGTEGYSHSLNLRLLPRWDGVDQILSTKLRDPLVQKNWQKGFRYWEGAGDKMPQAHFLLWEPHFVRPPSMVFLPVHHYEEFEEKTQSQPIHWIGKSQRISKREQTRISITDWELKDNISQSVF